MKTFLNQNRTFLVVALTLTLLALFKINQAHAHTPQGPQWVHIGHGFYYDLDTLWSPKKGVHRFVLGTADDGFAIRSLYELDCAEATTRYLSMWFVNSAGQTLWPRRGKPDEVVPYPTGSAFYRMDRILCKR